MRIKAERQSQAKKGDMRGGGLTPQALAASRTDRGSTPELTNHQ